MARRGPVIAFASLAVVLTGGAYLLAPRVLPQLGWPASRGPEGPRPEPRRARPAPAGLVEGDPDLLRVPPDVIKALGIRTVPAKRSTSSRSLVLNGSLALDANRLARVHPRFGGEVVEIGTIADPAEGIKDGVTASRPLRFGDVVREGQLLAVLWSTPLGEKKSEYIDALSQLGMERETLRRQETLLKDEAVPERNVREAKRSVEAGEIAVDKVERTLRSLRLTDEEIESIRIEADRIRSRSKLPEDRERLKAWARLEVRAPFEGTVVERNIAVGDIVETTTDLFKIADLRQLAVWAYVYEEDLPLLLSVPSPVPWSIRVKTDPQIGRLDSSIEEIGDIIDPSQHTALVTGRVGNAQGRLRAGQFITATVELPSEPGELEIPTSAVVEDGDESVVLIQPAAGRPEFALRHVSIIRHTKDVAHVRAVPGPDAGGQLLRPGDLVASSGSLELRATLRDLRGSAGVKD